jgi:DNA-binding XRE family transcriptional regulator
MTRQVLGELIGRVPQTIHLIEVGDRLPGLMTLYNLAVQLGVTTDYLLGLEED